MKKYFLWIAVIVLFGTSLAADINGESGAFSSLLRLSCDDIEQILVPEPAASGKFAIDANNAAENNFLRKSDPAFEYLEKDFLNLDTLKFDASDIPSKAIPIRYLGHSVSNENFARELTRLTGARFTGGNSAKLLFGPDSFAMRDKLMAKAERSVYISVYSFHDDITGNQTADLLIAKKKQGLDIKILVDKKVAVIHGRKVLRRMQKAGIEILRYWEKGRLIDIWHVKSMIIDGKYAFVGGMNIGDAYSHKNPAGPKWKDFDLFFSGPAVTETLEIYARQWNAYAKAPLSKIDVESAKSLVFEKGGANLSVVFQNPPYETGILDTILKSIYGAKRRINIANSYFIAIPKLRRAIIDAGRRGVEVNILTNTSKSIDSEAKQAAVPIIRSLAAIYPSGANIYLNQGENLHAKFMTVDGAFATIGSYNMHPRSEKYDTEMNINIVGGGPVRQFDEAFGRLISGAKKVKSLHDLSVESGFATFIADLIAKYFFSQLSRS